MNVYTETLRGWHVEIPHSYMVPNFMVRDSSEPRLMDTPREGYGMLAMVYIIANSIYAQIMSLRSHSFHSYIRQTLMKHVPCIVH